MEAKILEIVGLDRDQFAQIVMIAQNDFLRFLQSGTDERVKILRRIFGTNSLGLFQDNLKSLAREKEEARKAIIRDFERYGVDTYKREEVFAEWTEQIKTDKASIRQADLDLSRYDASAKELAGRIAVAEEILKKFSELAASRAAFTLHSDRAGEIALMSVRRERGEIALRRVKTLADRAAESAEAYTASCAGLERAKSDSQRADSALEQAEKRFPSSAPSTSPKKSLTRCCTNRRKQRTGCRG